MNDYHFGFNGKEKDPEGLWGNSAHYDYGFRIYDPTYGRFLSVDPLTSKFPWYTPYQFAENSPVMNIDLDGLEPKSSIEYWETTTKYPHGQMYKADGYWVFSQTLYNGEEIHQYWDAGSTEPWIEFDPLRPEPIYDDVRDIAVQSIGFTLGTVMGATFIEGLGIGSYARNVGLNYVADYGGHVVAGDGYLGSFGKLDHIDNFLPNTNSLIGNAVTSLMVAGFDYSYDGGFESVFDTKNLFHAGSDFVINFGFSFLPDAIGKKKFNELIGLKKEADQLHSKYIGLAQGVLYNPKGFRNASATYNKYSNKASKMLDASYEFGSQITKSATLGATNLGRLFRQEAAKNIVKNKILDE